jgi:metal-sulfur cluster biosynthetic enzyme
MVLDKLKNVIDPELFVNIVDLGLIYEIKLGEQKPSSSKSPESPPATEPNTSESENAAPTPRAADGLPVHIDMTMTSPACPAGPALISGAKREVGAIEGVGEVEVKIVLDPPWTPDRMTEDAKDQLGIF